MPKTKIAGFLHFAQYFCDQAMKHTVHGLFSVFVNDMSLIGVFCT